MVWWEIDFKSRLNLWCFCKRYEESEKLWHHQSGFSKWSVQGKVLVILCCYYSKRYQEVSFAVTSIISVTAFYSVLLGHPPLKHIQLLFIDTITPVYKLLPKVILRGTVETKTVVGIRWCEATLSALTWRLSGMCLCVWLNYFLVFRETWFKLLFAQLTSPSFRWIHMFTHSVCDWWWWWYGEMWAISVRPLNPAC